MQMSYVKTTIINAKRFALKSTNFSPFVRTKVMCSVFMTEKKYPIIIAVIKYGNGSIRGN